MPGLFCSIKGHSYDALKVQNFDVVIGPQCSNVCRHVGRLAAYLDLPQFSGVCQGIEMLDKVEFRVRKPLCEERGGNLWDNQKLV